MFAELLGKEAGYCQGKGGSMHIADQDTGNLGANAIVGGSAGDCDRRGVFYRNGWDETTCVCFFGDGALGTRADVRVHEHGAVVEIARDLCLRKQSIQRIHPSIGNNGGQHESARGKHLGFIRSRWTGRMCARCLIRRRELIARARRGEGPAFLLCNTYRYLRASCRRHQPELLPLERGRAIVAHRARPAETACRLVDRAKRMAEAKIFEQIEKDVRARDRRRRWNSR